MTSPSQQQYRVAIPLTPEQLGTLLVAVAERMDSIKRRTGVWDTSIKTLADLYEYLNGFWPQFQQGHD